MAIPGNEGGAPDRLFNTEFGVAGVNKTRAGIVYYQSGISQLFMKLFGRCIDVKLGGTDYVINRSSAAQFFYTAEERAKGIDESDLIAKLQAYYQTKQQQASQPVAQPRSQEQEIPSDQQLLEPKKDEAANLQKDIKPEPVIIQDVVVSTHETEKKPELNQPVVVASEKPIEVIRPDNKRVEIEQLKTHLLETKQDNEALIRNLREQIASEEPLATRLEQISTKNEVVVTGDLAALENDDNIKDVLGTRQQEINAYRQQLDELQSEWTEIRKGIEEKTKAALSNARNEVDSLVKELIASADAIQSLFPKGKYEKLQKECSQIQENLHSYDLEALAKKKEAIAENTKQVHEVLSKFVSSESKKIVSLTERAKLADVKPGTIKELLDELSKMDKPGEWQQKLESYQAVARGLDTKISQAEEAQQLQRAELERVAKEKEANVQKVRNALADKKNEIKQFQNKPTNLSEHIQQLHVPAVSKRLSEIEVSENRLVESSDEIGRVGESIEVIRSNKEGYEIAQQEDRLLKTKESNAQMVQKLKNQIPLLDASKEVLSQRLTKISEQNQALDTKDLMAKESYEDIKNTLRERQEKGKACHEQLEALQKECIAIQTSLEKEIKVSNARKEIETLSVAQSELGQHIDAATKYIDMIKLLAPSEQLNEAINLLASVKEQSQQIQPQQLYDEKINKNEKIPTAQELFGKQVKQVSEQLDLLKKQFAQLQGSELKNWKELIVQADQLGLMGEQKEAAEQFGESILQVPASGNEEEWAANFKAYKIQVQNISDAITTHKTELEQQADSLQTLLGSMAESIKKMHVANPQSVAEYIKQLELEKAKSSLSQLQQQMKQPFSSALHEKVEKLTLKLAEIEMNEIGKEAEIKFTKIVAEKEIGLKRLQKFETQARAIIQPEELPRTVILTINNARKNLEAVDLNGLKNTIKTSGVAEAFEEMSGYLKESETLRTSVLKYVEGKVQIEAQNWDVLKQGANSLGIDTTTNQKIFDKIAAPRSVPSGEENEWVRNLETFRKASQAISAQITERATLQINLSEQKSKWEDGKSWATAVRADLQKVETMFKAEGQDRSKLEGVKQHVQEIENRCTKALTQLSENSYDAQTGKSRLKEVTEQAGACVQEIYREEYDCLKKILESRKHTLEHLQSNNFDQQYQTIETYMDTIDPDNGTFYEFDVVKSVYEGLKEIKSGIRLFKQYKEIQQFRDSWQQAITDGHFSDDYLPLATKEVAHLDMILNRQEDGRWIPPMHNEELIGEGAFHTPVLPDTEQVKKLLKSGELFMSWSDQFTSLQRMRSDGMDQEGVLSDYEERENEARAELKDYLKRSEEFITGIENLEEKKHLKQLLENVEVKLGNTDDILDLDLRSFPDMEIELQRYRGEEVLEQGSIEYNEKKAEERIMDYFKQAREFIATEVVDINEKEYLEEKLTEIDNQLLTVDEISSYHVGALPDMRTELQKYRDENPW